MSWIKHDLLGTIVPGQVCAFRARFPDASMLLIDGNAGDGMGIEHNDLFQNISTPTAKLLNDLAEVVEADVILCEHKMQQRVLLMQQFPAAQVVKTHADIPSLANGHHYAIWLSDPCGYAGHDDNNITNMRKIASQITYSDFIIVFAENALRRLAGVGTSPFWQTHQKYLPMLDFHWWRRSLRKRYIAYTPIIAQSPGFQYRILILSNYLSDAVKRCHGIKVLEAHNE